MSDEEITSILYDYFLQCDSDGCYELPTTELKGGEDE